MRGWPSDGLIKGRVCWRFEQLLERTFCIEHRRDSEHVFDGCAAGLLETSHGCDPNAGASRQLFLS